MSNPTGTTAPAGVSGAPGVPPRPRPPQKFGLVRRAIADTHLQPRFWGEPSWRMRRCLYELKINWKAGDLLFAFLDSRPLRIN